MLKYIFCQKIEIIIVYSLPLLKKLSQKMLIYHLMYVNFLYDIFRNFPTLLSSILDMHSLRAIVHLDTISIVIYSLILDMLLKHFLNCCRFEHFVIALEEASKDSLSFLKEKALKVMRKDHIFSLSKCQLFFKCWLAQLYPISINYVLYDINE